MWDVSFDNITLGIEIFWVGEMLYSVLIAVTKISIRFFLLRIFSHSPLFKYYTYVVIVLNVGILISFELASAFQYLPVYFFWARWTGESDDYICISLYAGAFSQGMILIVMDGCNHAESSDTRNNKVAAFNGEEVGGPRHVRHGICVRTGFLKFPVLINAETLPAGPLWK